MLDLVSRDVNAERIEGLDRFVKRVPRAVYALGEIRFAWGSKTILREAIEQQGAQRLGVDRALATVQYIFEHHPRGVVVIFAVGGAG